MFVSYVRRHFKLSQNKRITVLKTLQLARVFGMYLGIDVMLFKRCISKNIREREEGTLEKIVVHLHRDILCESISVHTSAYGYAEGYFRVSFAMVSPMISDRFRPMLRV